MENTEIRKLYDFFEKNKKRFFSKYPNKFIVISDMKEQGAFNTTAEAYNFAINKFEMGKFIIQHVLEKEEVQMFHSLVGFH